MNKSNKLGDLITLRYGKSLPEGSRIKGANPVFGSGGCVGTHDAALISGPGIIVGRKGTIGSVIWSDKNFFPLDTTYYVEVKYPSLPLRFVYYLLKNLPLKSMNTDAAVPGLNRENAHQLKFQLPHEKYREKITEILSNYDDLIKNNQRRIALLEKSAHLLYREWFVHFRFPKNSYTNSFNNLPETWQLISFDKLADFINGFAFKPRHLGITGLPIVKIPELKGGILDKTPRYEGEEVPEKNMLKNGDLLFSWSATLAVDFWIDGPAYLNQHLFKVIPNKKISSAFLLLALREAMPKFTNLSVGATMKHIRRSALSEVFIPLPNKELQKKFENIIDPIYEQIKILKMQNTKLTKTRDILLPRLMDGRIKP